MINKYEAYTLQQK